MEKDIITLSVKNFIDLYNAELERIQPYVTKDSNKKRQAEKCKFILRLLESLDENQVLSVEGCRGDNDIRDFNLSNSGSVVECIIKYCLTREKDDIIAKTWKDEEHDTKNGCIPWEIKASFNQKYYATPSNAETTLLVNPDGVSVIKKSEVLSYCWQKKKGDKIVNILPYHGTYGNRNHPFVKRISAILGFAETETETDDE